MLKGRKILIGITGSIAAYKSAHLVRLLVRAGAEVKVVMTPGALEFITPLTFSALSGNPVHSDFTENRHEGTWTNHVQLALWADLLIVAPLSANTLSKMAHGACDNFFLAVYMSARCPVMAAPAMDEDMWLHSATTENIGKLVSYGHQIIQPGSGALASGLSGKGRMAEPEEIYSHVLSVFHPSLPLKGKKALVTAGPTYEKLDPVRFIGNFSTGKMGFAIAEELSRLGAEVELVYGPGTLTTQNPGIHISRVVTGAEMAMVCQAQFPNADIVVLAAAVSDFRPVLYAPEKIKKQDKTFQLNLEKTEDIAFELGKKKKPGQVIVGFALETENEIENARVKLVNKNFDLLVLNSLKDEGAGFGTDTNKITLLWPGNKMQEFGLKSKSQAAVDIVNHILQIVGK